MKKTIRIIMYWLGLPISFPTIIFSWWLVNHQGGRLGLSDLIDGFKYFYFGIGEDITYDSR